jgi:hypothetical protein
VHPGGQMTLSKLCQDGVTLWKAMEIDTDSMKLKLFEMLMKNKRPAVGIAGLLFI